MLSQNHAVFGFISKVAGIPKQMREFIDIPGRFKMKSIRIASLLTFIICLAGCIPASGKNNPDLPEKSGKAESIPILLEADSTVCDVGSVHNFITNSTVTRAGGTNEWTILIGDDNLGFPSMLWTVPSEYADFNHYLYYGSLRLGYHSRLVRLSVDTSPGIDVLEPPNSVSEFDTHFHISDQSDLIPPDERINVRVHQNTYAWSGQEADDFIIYDYWIVNLNAGPFDSFYVSLHADCDVSSAGGGSGVEAYWRDDLVGYYRDDNSGEYVSYMYDADSPAIPGNDEGGKFDPKESLGYIGSRLLYCPPIVGSGNPSVQQGHGWWDWNSDPDDEETWFAYMSDGLWLDTPPSPHDFRFLQKLGPFEIDGGDSIRVVFGFGIGNGLSGMRSNLNNAHLLFENDYVYYDLPPECPHHLHGLPEGDDIELGWSAVEEDDLAGYNIYSSVDPEGPFQMVNSEPIDTTYFLYTPPDRGFFYFYATSEDFNGDESITSDTVALNSLPQPPPNFRAVPGDNVVHLHWSVVEGADAYRIYRSGSSGGPYSQIEEISDPDDSYDDTDVVNYQIYYYVATTLDDGYESPYSGEVEVTPNPDLTGRVLLVDDYRETDEGGNPLFYQERRRFYQRWGVYNFDYDVWVIAVQDMPDMSVLQNYQAVLFASDGEGGRMDGTWWHDVGSIGGGVLRDYLESGGKLLAIGQIILPWIYNSNPPVPGDFEYDWFGIDSVGNTNGLAWYYWDDFTWAIGSEPGYPDSMKLDVAKVSEQLDLSSEIFSLRAGADTLFLKGLSVDGSLPNDYMEPVAIIYRPGGSAVTALVNFSLYYMPGPEAHITMNNILRDEFGCTFYENPPPLPPWHAAVIPVVGDSLLISWDALDEDDVTTVNLYRSRNGGQYESIASVGRDIGQFVDGDIVPDSTYSYRLTCVDFAGQEGDFSLEITEIGGRPAPPENLVAESGDGQVILRWHSPDDPAIDSIRIYRGMGGNPQFGEVGSVSGSDTSYIDYDIVNRNFYGYFVTSISEFGVESHPSDTDFAFPHAPGREGILIVNGIDWDFYGDELLSLYQDHSFTDTLAYKYWDLFESLPVSEFPDPENVLGWGDLPPVFFDVFETIIWAGNNYNGDFEHWENNQANIMNFLYDGGNIILPVRYGADWFFNELSEYCGIVPGSWVLPMSDYLTARHDSLTNITPIMSQSLWEIPLTDNPDNVWIYEAANEVPGRHAGFITLPDGIGGGGGLCYIAGRPYRWNHNDLRSNFETIITYFLGTTPTGVKDDEPDLPDRFVLYQNYPNPFNPSTVIKFGLPSQSDVHLEIFDILGRRVNILADGPMEAGYHEIVWNGADYSGSRVSSGVYFYVLRTGDFASAKKMLILK